MILPIQKELRNASDPEKSQVLSRFFKTGKGEYGEGDEFLGITVPVTRKILLKYINLEFKDLEILIKSKYHEERLAAVLLLVSKFQKGNESMKKAVYDFYLSNSQFINNWDLVDLSAHHIIGAYLDKREVRLVKLRKLARSSILWERRMAIISTFFYIRKGDFTDASNISEMLLDDRHDLIHKAVGWMLREVGKHGGSQESENFINTNLMRMPRTTLRYAIERWPENKRRNILGKK